MSVRLPARLGRGLKAILLLASLASGLAGIGAAVAADRLGNERVVLTLLFGLTLAWVAVVQARGVARALVYVALASHLGACMIWTGITGDLDKLPLGGRGATVIVIGTMIVATVAACAGLLLRPLMAGAGIPAALAGITAHHATDLAGFRLWCVLGLVVPTLVLLDAAARSAGLRWPWRRSAERCSTPSSPTDI